MTGRIVLLVARPTPSGVDTRSLVRLADAVAARIAEPVRIAFLDQAEPSIHDALDDAATDGAATVTVVALAVPADPYTTAWIGRAVANWTETRASALDVRLAASLTDTSLLADAVADLAGACGTAVSASPAGFRSPSWSVLEIPDRHLMVCRGPRCTAYGAGATHRALSAGTRGTATQVTPVGCLGPCNLGPLVIDIPGGQWHQRVDPARAAEISTVTAG